MNQISFCTITEIGNECRLPNGKLHREDGPAIEYDNGYKAWYQDGKRHREDGQAIEFADGHESWYFEGSKVYCNSNEEFLKLIKLKAFW